YAVPSGAITTCGDELAAWSDTLRTGPNVPSGKRRRVWITELAASRQTNWAPPALSTATSGVTFVWSADTLNAAPKSACAGAATTMANSTARIATRRTQGH